MTQNNMTIATQKQKKVDPMNVKNIEEVIFLLQEGEQSYTTHGGISAQQAYLQGLEHINDLWK